MIKMLLVSILLCNVIVFASANNPFEKRAPFKEATIKYKLLGSSKGTSILYIKEYGKYLCEHEQTKMSMFGFEKEENKLTISTPDWVYTIDLNSKTGSKVTNFEKYMQQEYAKLTPSEQKTVRRNARKMGADFSQNMGGDVKFNAAMIHGYSCDKTTVMGMTSYTIHNTAIVLKMDGSVLGVKVKKEATSIDKGTVDSSHFDIPQNVKITYDATADSMMKEHAARMMQMLLHPEEAPSLLPTQNKSSEMPQQEDVQKLLKSLF